jgi:hypothetical protein
MAVEGQAEVIDGGAPPSEGAEKPNVEQPGAEKKAAVSGAQPEKTRDYDREIAGFKADLIKERKARQQYETDLAAARAESAAHQKRIQALVGVTPKSDTEVEEEAIKARLEALGYPSLSKEDLEAIREVRATKSRLDETIDQSWKRHNHGVVVDLRETLEKELGGKLSDRQMTRVVAEYVREAESNPEFMDRHEKGDKTLIAEFTKQLSEDWFEPARRKVTQQETQRYRAVPSGKDRGIVTQGEKKIDVNDPKAVEDLLVKGYRERNGEFSGRR